MEKSKVDLSALLLILFFAMNANGQEPRRAGHDLKAGLGMRSTPLGAALTGEVGYGLPIWGSFQDRSSYQYGFVRAFARAATSVTVNSLEAGVALHPISFWSVLGGRGVSSRSSERSRVVDCDQVECLGSLHSSFIGTHFAVANGAVFLVGDIEWRDIAPSRDGFDFYEDGNAITGQRGYDRFFTQSTTIGWRPESQGGLPPGFFLGLNLRRAEVQRSGDWNERLSVVSGLRHEGWRFLFSIGTYQSRSYGLSAAAGVFVERRIASGLSVE